MPPCLSCSELLIQEKEKLYVELKNILARQPGQEVEDQVCTREADKRGGGPWRVAVLSPRAD